ncbi:MAG: hypothetical protein LBD31_00040 [Treponema sp.]|nr:hypothetical protein [Treponema sp.]
MFGVNIGTLTIDGPTLTGVIGNTAELVNIQSTAALVLQSGAITGNTNTGSGGGGVHVQNGGTFTMNGGSITGNHVTAAGCNGGGVYVASGGTFNHSGGNISGNTANIGDDVYARSATFTRNGGTVGSYFPVGSGTAADPWLFGTYMEMVELGLGTTPGYYRQTANIDMDGLITVTVSGNRYLDGGGHIINRGVLTPAPFSRYRALIGF